MKHGVPFGHPPLQVTSYGVMLGIVALSNMARDWVLLIGLTAMLTQAAAKAGSEWNSTVLQDEQDKKELKTESEHLHAFPDEEEQHMAALLEDFGLQPRTIELINRDAKSRPDFMLRLHSKFELGLDLDAHLVRTSPWRIAVYTYASYVLGATLPLVPWLDPFFASSFSALLLSSLVVVVTLGAVSMFNASFCQTPLNRMKVLSLHSIFILGFLVVFLTASFIVSEAVSHVRPALTPR
eukprot:TRINITY_DN4772_c0_g1_i2.p1 TRINITY_DN4772_c0_g1~~TRINITY_DN4772_c0_g1_i2.p1  ORF type:complete len:238 (+),score=92.15 TRINITY_DN4772_c0_g1_i2:310-1023(+)